MNTIARLNCGGWHAGCDHTAAACMHACAPQPRLVVPDVLPTRDNLKGSAKGLQCSTINCTAWSFCLCRVRDDVTVCHIYHTHILIGNLGKTTVLNHLPCGEHKVAPTQKAPGHKHHAVAKHCGRPLQQPQGAAACAHQQPCHGHVQPQTPHVGESHCGINRPRFLPKNLGKANLLWGKVHTLCMLRPVQYLCLPSPVAGTGSRWCVC